MSAEFIQPDLMPALPEMVMLGMTCQVLVVDLFLPQERRGFTLLLSVATLALAIAAVFAVAPTGAVSSFGGSFVLDQLAVVLKVATCVVTILVFVYSRDYLLDHEIYKGEYYVLGLFATLGMMVMISAHSFLLVYLGLELLSLSLYSMIAFNRNSLSASESARWPAECCARWASRWSGRGRCCCITGRPCTWTRPARACGCCG